MHNTTLPKIGVTSQIIRRSKWYKEVDDLGFDCIEINRQNSKLYFDPFFLEKVRRYTRDHDLSIHSGTRGIFYPYRNFSNANLATLMAEIDLCRLLEAKQLVFHLNNEMLTSEYKERLKKAIDYSKDLDIRMMYESDSRLVASDAFEVLEKFQDVGYVFDLGHFNNGCGNNTLGCGIEEFVRNVKDRVEYIHASNNCGTIDEHNALSDGTLNWRYVLDLLDLSRVLKIIIEVRNLDMVESSFRDIDQYMISRYADNLIPNMDSGGQTLKVSWGIE